MKLIPIALFAVLALAGCTQNSNIDGEYSIDVEYSIKQASKSVEAVLPEDIDIKTVLTQQPIFSALLAFGRMAILLN